MTPSELLGAIETDRTFRIPAIRLAEAQAAVQPKTFMYLFDWPSTAFGGKLGSCHAIDIPFVFGAVDTPFGKMFAGGGPGVRAMADKVQDAWISFARTGEPAVEGVERWPAYETSRRSTVNLAAECSLVEAPMDEERRFWDGVL